MRGTILVVPDASHQGKIAANDGSTYSFTAAGWRDDSASPSVDMKVDFESRAGHAVGVRPVQGASSKIRRALSPLSSKVSRSPGGGNAQSASGSNSSGASARRQQRKRGRGNFLAAMLYMSTVFVMTPIAIPLIGWMPLIGQVEMLLMLFVPGFLGGWKAGSVKKAIAAALIVGVVYGLFLFMFILALLKFVVGLPFVGPALESALDTVHGLGVSATFMAIFVTYPLVITLIVGALIGSAVRGIRK